MSTRPRQIYWRAVLVTGGLAWLMVLGFVGLTFAVSLSAAARKAEQMAALPEEFVSPPAPPTSDKSAKEAAVQKVAASAATNKPEPQETALSFKKAPASPPLSPPGGKAVTEPFLPASEQALPGRATDFENFGTQVSFAGSPAEAAQQASKERKLLFVLHLAGNFEDAKFT